MFSTMLEEALEEASVTGTVESFLTFLSTKIIAADKRSEGGKYHNPNALGLLMEALNKVRSDVKGSESGSDVESLKKLKTSIGKRFTPDFSPAKATIKAIDAAIASAK